jgi:L-rhamnose mutarotase
VGSVIRVRPERREEYVQLHRDVPAAVLDTLRACGITNYSIFLHGDLLFGYFEYVGDDLAADSARMAADPATQAWWKLTDPCQERLPSAADGEWWATATEVFHLD